MALGVAYYRHFYPVVVRLRAIVAAAKSAIRSSRRLTPSNDSILQPQEERYWFVKRAEAGGGPMFDFGCHRIEILLSLFGPVRETVGLTANVVFDREVEDTAVAALRFASGPCATVTVTHAAVEPRDTVRIFGTAGSIHMRRLNAGGLLVSGTGRSARRCIRRQPTCISRWSRISSTLCSKGRAPLVDGDSWPGGGRRSRRRIYKGHSARRPEPINSGYEVMPAPAGMMLADHSFVSETLHMKRTLGIGFVLTLVTAGLSP